MQTTEDEELQILVKDAVAGRTPLPQSSRPGDSQLVSRTSSFAIHTPLSQSKTDRESLLLPSDATGKGVYEPLQSEEDEQLPRSPYQADSAAVRVEEDEGAQGLTHIDTMSRRKTGR